MWTIALCVILLVCREINAGADMDVLQVKSPYVDLQDNGPLMSMNSNSRLPVRYYPQGSLQHGCIACQYGSGSSTGSSYSSGYRYPETVGSSGKSFSSGYQSSGTSGYNIPGSYQAYSSPVQTSSTAHEFKKEQKFVNGQQTYDFHLEKEYKDGNLVKNEIREKTPQDFGVHNYPHRAEPYGSSLPYIPAHGSPSYTAPKAASSSYSSSSSHSSYNILPQPSSDVTFEGTAPREVLPGQYQSYGANVGARPEGANFGVQHGDADFDAEVERLRKEMEMRTLSLHHGSLGSIPTHQGGSHRTEVRTEMKYVNGKPVYIKNEERKYKDGKLIHDETEEKGPQDLGTTGIVDNRPIHVAPARVYSTQYEQNVRQEEQYPASRYPAQTYDSSSQYTSDSRNEDTSRTRYQPSSYSSESQAKHTGNSYAPTETNYRSASHGSSHYVPERVYTTETREERDQIRTAIAHQPNSYATDTEYRYKYQPTSYSSPQTGGQGAVPYRTTTTTLAPETTIAPRRYDYSSSQTQENAETSRQYRPYRPTSYDSRPNPSDRYIPRSETYGTSRYANERTTERRSEVHSPQTVATTTTTTTTTTTPRPTVRSYRRPVASQLSQSEDRITETSQSSHYNENPSSNYYPQRGSEQKTPTVTKDLNQEREYSQSFERHSQTSEVVPQSPKTYQPNSYSSSVTRKEDTTHKVSSAYSPSQYDRRVGQGTYYRKYGTAYDGEENEDENEDENEEEEEDEPNRNYLGASGKPSLNSGAPVAAHSRPTSNKYPARDEPQRYDISPLVDGAESEADTHEIRDRPRPTYNNNYKPIYSPHESSHSQYYEESRSNTSGQSIYRPHLQPVNLDQHSSVALTNSTSQRTDHRVTTVIPSRWVETRTKWRYFNGRLISETQHHKYYENGILIHDNSTEKSRDQLAAEGVDVQKLDLTASQLAQYGPTVKSTTHSQSHEVSQIQRFRNGQQTYELNHDRRFQDGQLVHENKEEKNENDFAIPDHLKSVNHQQYLSQHLDQHAVAGGYGSRGHETDSRQSTDYNTNRQQYHSQIGGYESAADLHQTADFGSSNPSGFVRKHEVRQEEEFVNGQKVYNLFHEKEYQDGNLIRENKTELGPEDLGAQSVVHRDALQDLLGGKTTSARGREALHQQQKTTENILTTQCLTCSNQMLSSGGASSSSYMAGGHSSSVLGSLGIPIDHVNSAAGTTYKHDVNVEEHYENGQMVKGREDSKKWRDGRLIDAKTEHYYDGSSRTGLDLSGSQVFGGGSSLDLSGTQEGRTILGSTHETNDEDCPYNHCMNGASCRKSGKNQVCICKFGFKGTVCEEAYCPKSYCRYGGSCSISAGLQTCVCPSGYTGHRCSTRLHTIRVGG